MGGTESKLDRDIVAMTRRELHEKISETFEPKPSRYDPRSRVWLGDGSVICPFVSRDYDTDEAANAMLRDSMRRELIVVIVAGDPRSNKVAVLWRPHVATPFDPQDFVIRHPAYMFDAEYVVASNVLLAIVDAYSKWKKIT